MKMTIEDANREILIDKPLRTMNIVSVRVESSYNFVNPTQLNERSYERDTP